MSNNSSPFLKKLNIFIRVVDKVEKGWENRKMKG
jgi:hypothetical protein